MQRRDFLRVAGAGSVLLMGSRAGGQSANEARDLTRDGGEARVKELSENLDRTEQYLRDYPLASGRLAGYLTEVRERLQYPCPASWMAYQSNRLDRIRWLVAPCDDGRASGFSLRMRPYDIPWTVWAIGVLDDESRGRGQFETSYNGVLENAEKIIGCPDLTIEFTDQFADYCYLCSRMTAEGCPKFERYRSSFPQSAQMDGALRSDCESSLVVIGLEWTDTPTSRQLQGRCVDRAADPAAFSAFPLPEGSWEHYRRGIAAMEARGMGS